MGLLKRSKFHVCPNLWMFFCHVRTFVILPIVSRANSAQVVCLDPNILDLRSKCKKMLRDSLVQAIQEVQYCLKVQNCPSLASYEETHRALVVTDRKKMHASTGHFEMAGVLGI